MRIPGPGEPRPTPTLWAAAVGSGVVDLVDMLLPLWAGAGLALTGTGAGILTAMLPLGSLAGRPLAGRLVDDGHRAAPLIGGLFAGALGAALLAATSGPWLPGLGALVLGLGVGLVLIATMAVVADRSAGGADAGFAELFAWESRGTLVALVVGVTLAASLGYPAAFWVTAAACLAACCLVAMRAPSRGVVAAPGDTAGSARLVVVFITALAQSALMLVAMLRLQRHEGLDILIVSLILLPGLVLFALAGSLFSGLTRGRRPAVALYVAYIVVGAGAVLMALWPTEWGIGAGWVLAAGAIAVAVPLQRAAATGSGHPLGQALGRYGMTVLAGSSAGAVAAGYAFTHLPWIVVCGSIAALLVTAAGIGTRRRRWMRTG